MSSPHIRPFQRNDQEAVRWLIVSGLAEHFGHIDPAYNHDLNDIQRNYLAEGHLFVVAEREGILVATGALLRLDEQRGQLVRMSVHPTHRRQGLGRTLVAHLLQAARTLGLQKVVVETNIGWEDAVGLYQSCGFVEYDRDTVHVYMLLEL